MIPAWLTARLFLALLTVGLWAVGVGSYVYGKEEASAKEIRAEVGRARNLAAALREKGCEDSLATAVLRSFTESSENLAKIRGWEASIFRMRYKVWLLFAAFGTAGLVLDLLARKRPFNQ